MKTKLADLIELERFYFYLSRTDMEYIPNIGYKCGTIWTIALLEVLGYCPVSQQGN